MRVADLLLLLNELPYDAEVQTSDGLPIVRLSCSLGIVTSGRYMGDAEITTVYLEDAEDDD